MTLGDRVRELRIRKRQTLIDVAEATGASKAHLWEIEQSRSRNPSLDLLKKLAEHFGTSVAYLVDESIGDQSKADRFVQRNSQQLSLLSDSDLRLLERMISRLCEAT